MNVNEARELVPEFKAAGTILGRQRRRLIRFIYSHQGYLVHPRYRDKAARSYLRDLSNAQVADAVQEILKSYDEREGGQAE